MRLILQLVHLTKRSVMRLLPLQLCVPSFAFGVASPLMLGRHWIWIRSHLTCTNQSRLSDEVPPVIIAASRETMDPGCWYVVSQSMCYAGKKREIRNTYA